MGESFAVKQTMELLSLLETLAKKSPIVFGLKTGNAHRRLLEERILEEVRLLSDCELSRE